MPIQSYGLSPERIGTSLGRIEGHAQPMIVLGVLGQKDNRKKNTGQKTKYRRWLPKGATAANPNQFFQNGTGDRTAAYVAQHQISDGITPMAETIVPQDIEVDQKEFGMVYGFTNRTQDMSEDPIPSVMEEMLGERIGLVREMVLYGVLKGCTNKFYGGTGTSRATVNGRLTLSMLRKVERSLKINHAQPARKLLQPVKASGNYNTSPTDACFPVFISSDLASDVRDLPKFIEKEKYGDSMKAVAGEIGACEEFRFIVSPELVAVQDSGAAIAGTVPALYSTSGTYADVYQVIVGSADAWGHLGLNLTADDIALVPTSQKDKTDPLGQRGYVGARFYYNAVRLNEGQMAVLEVAANALTD
jgi:N4-gp56 family major capsid protein